MRKPIEEMELLLENSPLAFVLTNANNDFLFVNSRFSEMFGYSENEILRKKIQELTHPDSVAESIKVIKIQTCFGYNYCKIKSKLKNAH